MATKEKSPAFQHQGSTEEEHTSPKKRRKVNHGRYDTYIPESVSLIPDVYLDSMCLLSAIGKQTFCQRPMSMASMRTVITPLDKTAD